MVLGNDGPREPAEQRQWAQCSSERAASTRLPEAAEEEAAAPGVLLVPGRSPFLGPSSELPLF